MLFYYYSYNFFLFPADCRGELWAAMFESSWACKGIYTFLAFRNTVKFNPIPLWFQKLYVSYVAPKAELGDDEESSSAKLRKKLDDEKEIHSKNQTNKAA